jgi:hypothetical protein
MADIQIRGSLIEQLSELLTFLRSRLVPPPPPTLETSILISLGTREIIPQQCPPGDDDIEKWTQDKELIIVNAVRVFLGIETGNPAVVKNLAIPCAWMLDGQTMAIYVQFVLSSTDIRTAKRVGFRVCWRDGIPSQKAEGYGRQIRDMLSQDTKRAY